VNQEAATLFGYALQTLRLLIIQESDNFFIRHMHPDDWRTSLSNLLNAVATKQPIFTRRTRMYHSSGMSSHVHFAILMAVQGS